MAFVVFTPPAEEPVSIAEAMQRCELDAGNLEPAPAAPTAALVSTPTPGNVNTGAHRYVVTFVTSTGETQAGTISAAVTVADSAVNGQVELSDIQIGGALVTARKIYRTAAGGTAYLLLATIANNTATTYTDNIADASLGAGAPTTNTTADPALLRMIQSVRERAETELGRALVTQTVDAYFRSFPTTTTPAIACYDQAAVFFDLPQPRREFVLPPLQSVTSITYVDTAGVTQTLDPSKYVVDAVGQPARIEPAYGMSWPVARDQANSVKIRFVAGYGAAAAVPASVKDWILLHVRNLFDNPSSVTNERYVAVLPFCDSLLDPHRVGGRL